MTNLARPLVGAVLALAVVTAACGSATPSSGAVASEAGSAAPASAVPSAGPATPAATGASPAPSVTVEPSVPAQPSVAPSPTAPPPTAAPATPRPTPAPGKPATVVFTNLKLDAKDDPDGRNRRFEFASRGTGTISVGLSTLSPQGSAIMCLSADGTRLACKTTSGGTITAKTSKRTASFVLTVRGEGVETPLVEVTITFPAQNPAVTIRNARFDGTAFPDTNGIAAIVRPRAAGDVAISADWGGHPFLYEVDLFEQDGPGSQSLPNQGPATRMSARLRVTATHPWKLLLQNIEGGFGPTIMVATVAWP